MRKGRKKALCLVLLALMWIVCGELNKRTSEEKEFPNFIDQ